MRRIRKTGLNLLIIGYCLSGCVSAVGDDTPWTRQLAENDERIRGWYHVLAGNLPPEGMVNAQPSNALNTQDLISGPHYSQPPAFPRPRGLQAAQHDSFDHFNVQLPLVGHSSSSFPSQSYGQLLRPSTPAHLSGGDLPPIVTLPDGHPELQAPRWNGRLIPQQGPAQLPIPNPNLHPFEPFSAAGAVAEPHPQNHPGIAPLFPPSISHLQPIAPPHTPSSYLDRLTHANPSQAPDHFLPSGPGQSFNERPRHLAAQTIPSQHDILGYNVLIEQHPPHFDWQMRHSNAHPGFGASFAIPAHADHHLANQPGHESTESDSIHDIHTLFGRAPSPFQFRSAPSSPESWERGQQPQHSPGQPFHRPGMHRGFSPSLDPLRRSRRRRSLPSPVSHDRIANRSASPDETSPKNLALKRAERRNRRKAQRQSQPPSLGPSPATKKTAPARGEKTRATQPAAREARYKREQLEHMKLYGLPPGQTSTRVVTKGYFHPEPMNTAYQDPQGSRPSPRGRRIYSVQPEPWKTPASPPRSPSPVPTIIEPDEWQPRKRKNRFSPPWSVGGRARDHWAPDGGAAPQPQSVQSGHPLNGERDSAPHEPVRRGEGRVPRKIMPKGEKRSRNLRGRR